MPNFLSIFLPPHKQTHQDGGDDEISVAGLAGELTAEQKSAWAKVSGKPTTFAPATHKTSHQDAGDDEISVAGLAGRQIFIPYDGKIADITHPDTNKHTLDLATILTETRKIIGLIIYIFRMAGTGGFIVYPAEGATGLWISNGDKSPTIVIADGTQRLQYSLYVANDDWDIYCSGYVVET